MRHLLEKTSTRIRNNSFARPVALLASGAGLAHAITAIALPLLSRIYAPEDFSALAVFNGLFSILTVIACLRYDIAVSLPAHDDDSTNLLGLALLIAGFFSLIISLPLLIWSNEIANFLGQPSISAYIHLLPFAIFLSATASAMQNWFIRAKGYSLIAISRVTQSVGAVALQFGVALFKPGPIGLILGAVCNTGAASVVLGYGMYRRGTDLSKVVTWARMRALAYEHRYFPQYSTLEALCNMASIQLPVLLIAALVSGPEPGYILLAITVLQAPMALFGIAIGQVYLSHAPEEYRKGTLVTFTVTTITTLVRSGVGPLIAAGVAAPFFFELVFGIGWQRAGVLLAWMTPWFIMQFLTSPISMALAVTGHQPRALLLQIFNLVCRTGAVYLAWTAGTDFIGESYAVSGLVSYFVYYVVVMRTIGAPTFFMANALWRNAVTIALWILLSLVSIYIARLILF